MRTMARAAVLLLVVAFMAGVWDARNEDERRPARSTVPFRTEPVEQEPQEPDGAGAGFGPDRGTRGVRPGAVHLRGVDARLPGPLRGPGRGRHRRAAGPARAGVRGGGLRAGPGA